METVYDLCSFYMIEDDEMKIYSLEQGEVVFEGSFDEAMHSSYANEDVCTFEVDNGIICINIE